MSYPPSPKKEWELTEQAFSKFLAWLNPDPNKAGQSYENIRHKLINIFVCRGCTCPEDLTDETINRVIRKMQGIGETYVGDRALYFYGVARNVYLEYVRQRPVPAVPPAPPPDDPSSEEELACLEKCLQGITPRSRDLVMDYFREEKHAKIELRKKMAEQLGIPLNALRIRACRIRANLEECVSNCLRELAAG
jgi:DNA-directed RNA polymerase specialized sigma24 family protein